MSASRIIDARPLSPSGTVSPAVVLSAVRRQRGWLLLCLIAVPALAWVALGQVVLKYTSVATVIYDRSPYAARELQSILQADPAGEATIASQVEIARSLRVAERIADRFGLADDPEFNLVRRTPSLIVRLLTEAAERVRVTLGLPEARRLSAEDERAGVMLATQEAIAVLPVRGSRALQMSFTAADRRLAAEAANAVAALYVRDQLDLKYAAIDRADQWLSERAADLSAKVRAAEERIAAYRAQAGLVQGVQAELVTEQASRLAADLQAARNDLAAAEARARDGRAAQATVSPGAVAARAQAEAVAAQQRAALERLGPNHPEVRALAEQAAALRVAAGAETGRGGAALQAETRAARERVDALEQAVRSAGDAVARTSAAQVPLNALQREADAARTLLVSVSERAQQTGQQRAIETPDARLISPALPAIKPSFPRTAPLMAAATVAGLFLGLCLVYWREVSEQTFRGGEDVRLVLGLPCLALLPRLGRRQLGRVSMADYVAARPLSPFAEQTRSTRVALLTSAANPRVVAITAARPAEGKTVAAIALGRSAALSGERVVVVDCDLRQPSLGHRMGAGARAGLVDVLLGTARLDEVIVTDPLTGLAVIPAGSTEAGTAGLFRSAAMDALLATLRERFELVLLDAPPAYAMTDARHVARLADSTLMCVRWRATPREVVRAALTLLEEAGARVAGVVLTRVDPRVHTRSGFADAEIYHPRYGGYFRE